ncbi:MAG: hypothetical protein IE925_17195, partial [Rhodobacterales bacterium]|nr:hypothetical protein [Rhodobacterales bacterium]
MTRRSCAFRARALLAASTLALAAACASTTQSSPASQDGTGENWLSAAWHWMFPPDVPAPPPPPP